MQTDTIETTSLGDRSYLVSDGEVAAVVDPQRDLDRILDLADRRGVRIAAVFETHIHNDYVTGGYQLARTTGADYRVAADDEVLFAREPVRDGDDVAVGSLTFRVVHTPGHTPTHLSYVVSDGSGARAVFTGGSMLYGTVGRTDLIARSLAERLTRDQYRSVRTLAERLDDGVRVHPTHGFGSFCSSAPAESTDVSTIGRERDVNLALTLDDEDAFVDRLLAGLDAYPKYYAHMAPRNRLGPEPVDLTPPVEADRREVAARVAAGEWVVDLRDRVAFARDHTTGTVGVELSDSFSTYLGWLVPWGRPVSLLGDDAEQIAAAQRQMLRIGIDRPASAAVGGPDAWGTTGARGSFAVVDFAAVADVDFGDGRRIVLDVRRDGEWAEGRLPAARHVPLHELETRMDDIPAGPEIWVHCGSGYRASIAASLLIRAGRTPVLIDDDYARAVELGLATS